MRILLFMIANVASAATIASGSLTTTLGDQAFSSWSLSLTGPGLQLTASHSLGASPLAAPLWCVPPSSACTLTFTGSGILTGGGPFDSALLTLNGTTYQGLVFFDLTFTGAPQTSPSVCVSCEPGRPPVYESTWLGAPFSMTGVVTVRSEIDNSVILTETISGQGIARGFRHWDAGFLEGNYSTSTFAFDTPEPSTGAALIAAILAGLVVQRRRRL